MNTFIKTEKGYKKQTKNKGWVYYVDSTCENCGKSIITTKIKFSNKRKHTFCPDNKYCMYEYYQKQKDIKAYNILQNINDPNFYYLIGLICTDGCITWPGCNATAVAYKCTIELNRKDKKLLQDIQKIFGGKLWECKSSNTWRWVIHNKLFIEYLREEVGLTNNKSFTLNIEEWFNCLSDDSKNHFIRGVIDGDGCIHKTKHDYWVASICTYSKKFQTLLMNHFKNFNFKINAHGIHFNGSYIIDPLKHILTNEYLHLKRKYEKFAELLKDYSK